jgi:hypothetical protein
VTVNDCDGAKSEERPGFVDRMTKNSYGVRTSLINPNKTVVACCRSGSQAFATDSWGDGKTSFNVWYPIPNS